MLDIETYNLTRNLPGGSIVQMKHLDVEDVVDEPITKGVLIGRVLGLAVVLALGAYSYLTI